MTHNTVCELHSEAGIFTQRNKYLHCEVYVCDSVAHASGKKGMWDSAVYPVDCLWDSVVHASGKKGMWDSAVYPVDCLWDSVVHASGKKGYKIVYDTVWCMLVAKKGIKIVYDTVRCMLVLPCMWQLSR